MTHPKVNDRHLERVWDSLPKEGESLSKRAFRSDYVVNPETGCWEWQKYKLRGYGRTTFNGRAQWAHRAYYEAAFGPIADGLHVHHRCENPACVFPGHLELTRHAEHLAYHKQEISTLTWDDVRAIREAACAGVPQVELRLQYGLAQPTMSDLITGVTWKDSSYTPPALERTCARPSCSAPFTTSRANKVFCSAECQHAHNSNVGWRRRKAA